MAQGNKLPISGQAQNRQAQTSAAGATFVALSVLGVDPCDGLDMVNMSGTTIEYQRNGAGIAIQIRDGSSRWLTGFSDASQIAIRRTDQSTTQVTVQYEIHNLG